MRRESPRAALAAITPSAVLVAAYLGVKFYYLFFLRPPVVAIVMTNYALTFDVTIWIEHLGEYFAQCFTPLALWGPSPPSAIFLGCALAIALAAAIWRAYRTDGPWVLVAGGIAVFIASLAAVFPQRTHFGSPYICTAVLGAAWLIVGFCRLIHCEGRWLALAFSILMVVVDSSTGGRAWRRQRVFRFVVDGSLAAERWMATAQRGARAGYDDILIPEDPVTDFVFRMGEVETFFPHMPSRVTLYDPAKRPKPQVNGALFRAPVPLTTPYQFPGAERHWDWLRRLVASPGRAMQLGSEHQFRAEDSSD
jgi:hypothetical protein